MNIDHEFTVPATADRAWGLLTDFEQVASCMPGAQLTGEEDGTWLGVVKVKVGPVTAQYKGSASFAERDDDAHHAVIAAKGREARGSGTASATIDLSLRPDGDATVVSVRTDLKISGKLAQFGSGMIQEVSSMLLGQFSQCLVGRITAPPAGEEAGGDSDADGGDADAGESDEGRDAQPTAGADQAPGSGSGPGSDQAPGTGSERAAVRAPAPVRTATVRTAPEPAPEPAAVDLVGVVGPVLLKRLAPVLAGAVVLVVLVKLVRALRRS
jgi:carbon monoxide dehydrogenase subunit G